MINIYSKTKKKKLKIKYKLKKKVDKKGKQVEK